MNFRRYEDRNVKYKNMYVFFFLNSHNFLFNLSFYNLTINFYAYINYLVRCNYTLMEIIYNYFYIITLIEIKIFSLKSF